MGKVAIFPSFLTLALLQFAGQFYDLQTRLRVYMQRDPVLVGYEAGRIPEVRSTETFLIELRPSDPYPTAIPTG
jgi:hypothetical protein